ncbi:MAG: polysaccharide biosynthesis/export family protein [Acidobacteriota bacterium]|nr:polysaccharide biosynthesis/export family protein [Acidobacteriota bacterium]
MRPILTAIFSCTFAFSQLSTRPAPAASDAGGPNLPAQRIGADDLLALSVYASPEFTRTLRVGTDGNIRLPMLKQRIEAQGLLPGDLESVIADALRQERLVVDPFVTVTMVEYHSRPISVAGAVRKPITFQAVGSVTLLDAISRAEGFSPEAGGEILVSRPGALMQRIAVKGLIDAADPDLNIKLTGGEEIRVPDMGRVFVAGNVRKPGSFLVHDSEDTTVIKVIALAEGLEPFASKQAFIYRPDDATHGKKEITIELSKIMSRKSPDVFLQAKDILYIPDNTGRRLTVNTIERLAGFGASTASGVLVFHR